MVTPGGPVHPFRLLPWSPRALPPPGGSAPRPRGGGREGWAGGGGGPAWAPGNGGQPWLRALGTPLPGPDTPGATPVPPAPAGPRPPGASGPRALCGGRARGPPRTQGAGPPSPDRPWGGQGGLPRPGKRGNGVAHRPTQGSPRSPLPRETIAGGALGEWEPPP